MCGIWRVDPDFPLVGTLKPRVALETKTTNGAPRPVWLPVDWETSEFPANLSLEAVQQWSEYEILALRGLMHWSRTESGFEQDVIQDTAYVWRDAQRLMRLCGWPAHAVKPTSNRADHVADAIEEVMELYINDGAADGNDDQQPQGGDDHADDFRSVKWNGTVYEFSPNQAACVRIMWEHWKRGGLSVGEQTILEQADSAGNRLRDVFKGHEAWGTMIVPGSKGTFRLHPPPETNL